MSTAGVFTLVANDGKADRLIQATELLNQRIRDVQCARSKQGLNPTPTLADLERSHILHVNAHYKPYAALGFEYNKVKTNAGSPSLGQSVQFSIPQFGDFFHDMVARVVLSSCYSSVLSTPAQATSGAALTAGAYGQALSFPANGEDWDNTTNLANSYYSLCDPFGNTVTDDFYRNMVRYCQYPGERLFPLVKFEVNGNPLDEYTSDTVVLLRKYTVGADKLTAYKRMVGQEVELEGCSGPMLARVQDTHQTTASAVDHLTDASDTAANAAALNTPAAYLNAKYPENQTGSAPHLGQIAAATATGAPIAVMGTSAATHDNAPLYFDVVRESRKATNGPQTPKYWQPSLEIWNQLHFWFNKDARLSVPSVSIPYGQRYITTELAPQSQLVYEFPGLFVKQVVETPVEYSNSGTNVRVVRYRPYHAAGTISTITITNMELYVNNIFVNPEIHDIYIRRIGFSMIRVFRRHCVRSNSDGSDEKLLSQLKWPIEYMFMGLRPSWNQNANNPNQWRDWHMFGKVVDLIVDTADQAETPNNALLDSANQTTTARANPGTTSSVGQIWPDRYAEVLPVVSSLTVSAHGVKIHDAFPESFFNSYIPYHFGGAGIVAPQDRGCLMVNFSLFPRSYQPSGYINISRAREFYVSWTTSYVGNNTSADLVVVAIAINFLLITDGSAVLRYTT